MAGGGSVAILAFASDIEVLSSELHTGAAGDGGNGAEGQPGQAGGTGGLGATPGCAGGNGGRGGQGGAGAGGTGGVSVGILWQGDLAPVNLETVFDLGRFGDGGLSGDLYENDGLVGRSEALLRVD